MRSPFFLGLLAAAAVSVLTPACGDDDSSGGTGTTAGSSATAEDFYSSLTNLACTAIGPCCAKAGFDSSGQQCRALFGAQGTSKFDTAAYDPQKGRECLDKLKAVADSGTCQESGDGGFNFTTDPSCQAALPVKGGNKKPGEECEDDDQCATVEGAEVECHSQTEFLEGGGTKETRYCRVERPGKAGDGPCVWSIDGNTKSFTGSSKERLTEGYTCDAAQGLFCESGGAACKAFTPDGQSCSGGQCLKASYCKEGTCAPREAIGSLCDGFGNTCVEGAYCDKDTKQCKATLAEGAACTSSEQCDGSCTNGACKKSGGLEDFGYTLLCGPKK